MSEFVAPYDAPDASVDPDAMKALHEALVKAQAAFPAIERDREAGGEKFKYRYATLDEIIRKTRKPLTDNGLALLQWGTGEGLRTELRHVEGGVLSETFPWPTMPANPQEFGKLHTYLRRYMLAGVLGIAAEEDTDGRADGGAASPRSASPGEAAPPKITKDQNAKIAAMLADLEEQYPKPEGQLPWVQDVRNLVGKRSRAEFTKDDATKAIDWMQAQLDGEAIPFG